MSGYIYKITNDVNNKVYIGKTLNTIEHRFQEHCKDSNRKTFEHRPLYAAMRKYGINHFNIEEIEQCDNDILNEREIYWIGYYHSYTDGYNATIGGDGKSYINVDELLVLWEQGYNITQIANQTHHDASYIGQLLKNNGVASNEISKRGRESIPCVAIDCFDKTTKQYIQTFQSSRDAARWVIETQCKDPQSEGGYSSHIIECCKGKRKTCNGYIWEYSGLEKQ